MTDIYNICFYGGLILAILLLITSVVLFVVLKIPRVVGELTGRTARKGIEKLKGGAIETSAASKKEQAKYYNQDSGKMKIREAVSVEAGKKKDDAAFSTEKESTRTCKKTTDNLKKHGAEDKATDNLRKTKLDDRVTDILGDGDSETAVLNENVNGQAVDMAGGEEETAVLNNTDVKDTSGGEEETAVLAGDEATDVLADDEATDVLADDEATDVLADDEATDILADDEATDILADDEATDVLREGRMPTEEEDETSVLVNDMVVDRLAARAKVKYNVIVVNTDESL